MKPSYRFLLLLGLWILLPYMDDDDLYIGNHIMRDITYKTRIWIYEIVSDWAGGFNYTGIDFDEYLRTETISAYFNYYSQQVITYDRGQIT